MLLTLELVGGPRAGEARAVDGNMAFSVGTEHGATWVLPGAAGIARIELRRGRDGFLAEASGLVTMDGQPVPEGTTIALGHGTRIGLGDAVLRATLAEGGTYGTAGRAATASRPTITSILADVTPGGETASGMLPGRDGEAWLESITGPGTGRGAPPASAFGYASEMAVRPLPESEKPLATYLPEDWNAPSDRQSRVFQAQVPSMTINLRPGQNSVPEAAPAAPRVASDTLLRAAGIPPTELAISPERQFANAGAALKVALSGIARLERALRQLRADLGLPPKGATTPAELDPFVVLSDEDGLSARALAARVTALERDQAALLAGIRAYLTKARAMLDPDMIAARVKDRRGFMGHLAPGTAEWQEFRSLWSPQQGAEGPLSDAALNRDIEAAGTGGEFEESGP